MTPGPEYSPSGLRSHFDAEQPPISGDDKIPLHLRQSARPIERVEKTLLDEPNEVMRDSNEDEARQKQTMGEYVARREITDSEFGFARHRDDVKPLPERHANVDMFDHGNAD